MRYSAFISYNHRDRAWATWLHRSLERYTVPKRLRGHSAPWGELGARLPPVFRDRDELATSTDLAASVKQALAESATLIVICSPNSARSKWVDEEIRTFIAAGRAKFIRLIIVDGEPHAIDPERECLPPSLLSQGAPEPLAADVRKQADGKQGAKLKILAGMLGVPYDELRQREAARRHKRLAVFAVAASIGLVVMAGLTTFAFVARSEAIEQRKIAELRTVTAERTVDFVKGMFAVADPSEARGESITAREIVDRAADRLNSPALSREPVVRAELGVTLAEVYGALGLYRQSDELVRRTFEIHHQQPATRARQLAALGESQFRLGQYEAAERTFSKAWISENALGPALRSRILVGLGQTQFNLEKDSDAEKSLQLALKIDRARGPEAGSDVARDLEALGLNRFYVGDLEEAKPLIEQALALRQRHEGSLSPSVADNYNTLGAIAYSSHDLAAAETFFSKNIELDRRVLGADHPDVAKTMNNLARVLIEQQRFSEARPLLVRTIAIGERELGRTHDDFAFLYSNLAIVDAHTGRLGEAETLFNKAISVARPNMHRTLGPSLADLASVLCARGALDEALNLLDEAKQVTRADYPDAPWRSAWVENIRGECLLRSGQRQEGAALIARSSPIIVKEWPGGTLFATEARRRKALI
jgi:tetratricopeptide (TPR) repeat protein